MSKEGPELLMILITPVGSRRRERERVHSFLSLFTLSLILVRGGGCKGGREGGRVGRREGGVDDLSYLVKRVKSLKKTRSSSDLHDSQSKPSIPTITK